MYLHEYQSKDILKKNNIFVPRSVLVESLDSIPIVKFFFCFR
jgi:succinyl-CoA synthetase beta subunit